MSNKVYRLRSVLPLRTPKTYEPYSYNAFDAIDGSHPWREAVPGAYIDYKARIRKDGKIAYFNFELAKEIGLVPEDHPHELNNQLKKKILETFSLQIINEYDIKKNIHYLDRDIKKNAYMATRYLQLQHKNKLGETSGDGRSIWNGTIHLNGIQWDFSSCGTGVTRLSPGAVEAKKPIRTGSGSYSYGSGCAGLDEGISCAILSEIIRRSGVETERVLAVIELPNGNAINVRASKNLIRPSHFFNHLKQNNIALLSSGLNYFLDRQIQNEKWQVSKNSTQKYDYLLKVIAERYATFAAQLEDQYIFCWMDWDGDNMLATGGIIDYGSIRQFGLCHDRYRYDDEERWSTNLSEQKSKARYTVQIFAQAIEYVKTGKKNPVDHFENHPILKIFDSLYLQKRNFYLLERIGFSKKQSEYILKKYPRAFANFDKYYRWFEVQKTNTGFRKVGDGINWFAVYSTRQILLELPRFFIQNNKCMDHQLFLNTMKTKYTSKYFLHVDRYKIDKIDGFQKSYVRLMKIVAGKKHWRAVASGLAIRSAQKNILDPITGDGVLYVTDRLVRVRKKYDRQEILSVIESLINEKTSNYYSVKYRPKSLSKRAEKLLKSLLKLVYECRHHL